MYRILCESNTFWSYFLFLRKCNAQKIFMYNFSSQDIFLSHIFIIFTVIPHHSFRSHRSSLRFSEHGLVCGKKEGTLLKDLQALEISTDKSEGTRVSSEVFKYMCNFIPDREVVESDCKSPDIVLKVPHVFSISLYFYFCP